MVHSIFFLLVILTLSFQRPSSAVNSYEEPDWRSTKVHTWQNNSTLNETIDYEDIHARLILKTQSSGPVFAFGFICTGTCHSYFLGVMILGTSFVGGADRRGGFPGLVWLANRDKPIRDGGSLSLTALGKLVLKDSNGTQVWSTKTRCKSVGIGLQKSGNLLLYSNYIGVATLWQSFEHPTDTLLPGQQLFEDRQLTASNSADDWSCGRYYAAMTSRAFSAFVLADEWLMYLQLVLKPKSSRGVWNSSMMHQFNRGCFDIHQCREGGGGWNKLSKDNTSEVAYANSSMAYAAIYKGNLALHVGASFHSFQESSQTEEIYQFLRLDFDGHLRIYQWEAGGFLTLVYDLVVEQLDDCQYPDICGDYGVCRSRTKKCSCPKALNGHDYYFEQSNQLGCTEITPLSCSTSFDRHQLVDFGNLSFFNIIDSSSAISNVKNLEECKEACLQNCNCRGVFFKYGRNASYSRCYLPSKIFSMRESPLSDDSNFSFSAFIKVQLPVLAPRNRTTIPAIISGSFALAVLVFILIALNIQIRKEKKSEGEESFNEVIVMAKRFSYKDLQLATNNFKERLGGGGFGAVFKGILKDGTEIAVKRLDDKGQGMEEFLAEVETIGHIHHFNLVKLIGFCVDRSQLLVYEFLSNGSLDNWIFNGSQNPVRDWKTRRNIILGVAKGLAYLHEQCRQRIIHLDVKPQNILLDENFNAKISDFGLSKLMDRDQSYLETNIRGTPGYLAPEWHQLRITRKVDTYSFGIVVLEIVCGRKNFDLSRSDSCKHLLRLLQDKAEENCLIGLVDGSSMDMQQNGDDGLKMIKLAGWCL